MISRRELQACTQATGFNIYQAEKDYLQHEFLSCLYETSSNELVFKGGTALQKAAGIGRFSEDLDFTFQGEGDAKGFVRKAVALMGEFTETRIAKEESDERSITVKLKIRGPLFNGSEPSLQTIVLEISLREEVKLQARPVTIVPHYPGLPPYSALVMAQDEMLAEKVRAILTRRKPRDVYDAWFLLKKGAKANLSLVNEKLGYYGVAFSMQDFVKAVDAKEKNWKSELRTLMKSPPEFKGIAEFVLAEIKSQFEK